MRILIVDDEKGILELNRMILNKLGHDVLISDDAMEALELVKTTEFDIALIDFYMPVMNGLELAEEIKKYQWDNGKTKMSLIALSASSVGALNFDIETSAFDYFIEKPLNRSKLNDFLDKKRNKVKGCH